MTNKMIKIATIAESKGFNVREVGNGETLYIDLSNATIGIRAEGNKHEVWLNPKGFGSIHNITMTKALAKVGA